jgi:hypothetical protein
MSVGSTLVRTLRPGVQVPLANACACGGLAALVMHVGRTSEMRGEAFPVALAVASCASLVVMRVLFIQTNDPRQARIQAFLWPPLVGAIAGAVADVCMHVGGWTVNLSILGTELDGGVAETLVIAILSAFAGLVGTVLLLPQIRALERARFVTKEPVGLVTLADRLALLTWAAALGIGVVALVLARVREVDGAVALVTVATVGFLALCARVWRVRDAVAPMSSTPYR